MISRIGRPSLFFAIAILSLLTEIPVSKKLAMSGEITLRGKVLPVGGIKEKLLAAHREGIREAILPPSLRELRQKLGQKAKQQSL
jgi:ATP-dependent Lon protease